MKKLETIDALGKTHHNHDWHGPIMGNNSVSDFVLGAGARGPADDITEAIRAAVRNRIAVALDSRPGTTDETWNAWCNGKVDVDFSDIQKIILEID